jgi:Secretion system C-terminal sorting domain
MRNSVKLLTAGVVFANLRIALLCFLLVIGFNLLYAQQNPPADLDIMEEYDEEIETCIRPPKGFNPAKAMQADLFEMIPRKEAQHVKHMLNKNGEMSTVITFKRTSDTPDWVTTAAQSIITSDGVRSYDQNGKMITYTQASEQGKQVNREHLKFVREQGSFRNHELNALSENDHNELKANGATIKKMANNAVEVTFNDRMFRHDLSKGIYHEQFKDEDGKMNEVSRKHNKTKTGDAFIEFERHKREHRLNDGNMTHAERMVKTKNYSIQRSTKYKNIKSRSATIESVVTAYPNPIMDGNLYIQLPTTWQNNKFVEIQIFDMLGMQVSYQKVEKPTTEIQVSVETLPDATYFVRVYNGEKIESIKVIKINQF